MTEIVLKAHRGGTIMECSIIPLEKQLYKSRTSGSGILVAHLLQRPSTYKLCYLMMDAQASPNLLAATLLKKSIQSNQILVYLIQS